jgi:trehalose-6-phosphate synthase
MLSQFAGAAVELEEAVIVNPHETDAVAALAGPEGARFP